MLSDHPKSPASCPFLTPSCDGRSKDSICPDCALLTESLEAARPVERTLPSGLQARLRNIPDLPSTPAEPSVEEKIAACLEAASQDARRRHPMPDGLRRRLREIPAATRKPVQHLPWWIADSRWAMAACCLLTSALTLLAGDASARFQEIQETSNRIQQTTRSLTTDLGGHMTARLSLWAPETADAPPPMPRETRVQLSWLTATADSGRRLLKSTKDRASAQAAPLIGSVHRQKEVLELKADAWLGWNANEPAALSRERLQELKLRTEEALQLVLPENLVMPEDSPADRPNERKDP